MARRILLALGALAFCMAAAQEGSAPGPAARLDALRRTTDDAQVLREAAVLRRVLEAERGMPMPARDSLLSEVALLEATAHRRQGREEEAAAAFARSVMALRTHPAARSLMVERQALLAQHWNGCGRWDSARAVLGRAAQEAVAAGDSVGLRRLLHAEMALRGDRGDLRGAIGAGERILRIDAALGDLRDHAYAELGIARAMARAGLTAAFDRARSAHAAFDSLGDVSGAIGAIDLLITTYALTAQEAPLRELIEAGAAKAEARGNPADIARFRDRSGRFLLQRGKAREALSALAEGLALAGGAGPHAMDPAVLGGLAPRRAELLLDAGRAFRALGRTDSALAYLAASETLARAAGLGGADAGVEHGEVALDAGRTDQALRSGEAALQDARPRHDLALVARASMLLYKVHKQRGDTRAALAMHELHLASADSLGREQFRLGLLKRQIETDMRERIVADSIASAEAIERERLTSRIARLEADQARDRMQLLGAVALLLLVGGALWFRTDRKRRRERFEKEAAHLETQALRSQMNPHFIFNALNSINAFIQRNDPDAAGSYLTRFARVMRSV
ncbi:MAG: histidine kinase, partial [Flavobacteriales bacterium]|nr:histidine kinase [Flavobacteriales bacterium]